MARSMPWMRADLRERARRGADVTLNGHTAPSTPRTPYGMASNASRMETPLQRAPPPGTLQNPLGRIVASTPTTPLQRKGAVSSPARTNRTHTQRAEDVLPQPSPPQRTLQDWVEQLPMLFAEQFQLALMSAEELVHEPDLGVPLGLALHGLSLLSQVILPDSSFSLTASSRRHTRLFGSKRRSEGGYSAYLGNLLAAQRGAALSFASRMLSFVLCIVSLYITYVLFSKRRTYRLWYREEHDVLLNPHASLEAPPSDPPAPKTWSEWLYDLLLVAARQVPVVEWFVPPAPVAPRASCSERIYTLRVWDAYEAPLYLFTAYSPAHAAWWAVAGSLGMSPLAAWILMPVLMVVFSAQSYILAREFTLQAKDRQVLQAEMLREYDEKVRRSLLC